MQSLGQQFCLGNILRKKAKHQLAKIQMLRLKPKGTITSCSLTICVTQAHYISVTLSWLWYPILDSSTYRITLAREPFIIPAQMHAVLQRQLCYFIVTVHTSKAGDTLLFFFLNFLLQGEPGTSFDSHVLQVNI